MTFIRTTSTLALGIALLSAPLTRAQIDETRLDTLIETLRGDDFPARYEARIALQDLVSQASAPGNDDQRLAVEKQLLEKLATDQPDTTRLWLLRQIASIASDASVDSLENLLDDANATVADAARMTLEVNPSPRASEVLLAGLQAAKDERQIIGFINSLAQRDYAPASDSIAQHLQSQSDEVATVAATALGRLDTKEATAALLASQASAAGSKKESAELALLDKPQGFDFFETLARSASNRSIRSRAFETCVDLDPKKANRILVEILDDPDAPAKEDFVRIAMTSDSRALAKTVLSRVETLGVAEQETLLGTLTKRSKSSEKLALDLAQKENEQLTLQSIETLGRVGSAASLPLLLESLESRSRDLRETAADALAMIPDPRIDRALLKDAQKGELATRLVAVDALSYRPSPKAAKLVDSLLVQSDAPAELKTAALDAIERIGTTDSFPLLVGIVIGDVDPKFRKAAQVTLKRLTLRTSDPHSAWNAFEAGFAQANGNEEARMNLLSIIDSAPAPEAIDYLKEAWKSGDPSIRKTTLRVLQIWRNWDGGFALLDIADSPDATDSLQDDCYNGVGRLILGSDASYSFERKFVLAEEALKRAKTPAQRQSIIDGFRYSTWRERVHVTYNEVDPTLKEAVLKFAMN